MAFMSDLFGGGGGENIDGGGPEANAFKFEIPLDFSSSASAESTGIQGPIQFGSYSSSPIIGSGNDPVAGGSISSGLPGWVWPVALIGAYLLAKKKGAK